MENLLLSVVELVSAFTIVIGALVKIEKWTKGKVSGWLLKSVYDKLDNIEERVYRMDKNQCMNYLTEFLADIKNGVPKTEYQKARAHQVYTHYTDDLNGNSYIKEEWAKHMLHN